MHVSGTMGPFDGICAGLPDRCGKHDETFYTVVDRPWDPHHWNQCTFVIPVVPLLGQMVHSKLLEASRSFAVLGI
jgi:hypothetical protein